MKISQIANAALLVFVFITTAADAHQCPAKDVQSSIRLTAFTAAISAANLNCFGSSGLRITNPFLSKFKKEIAEAFYATDTYYEKNYGSKRMTDSMQTTIQNNVSLMNRSVLCRALPELEAKLNDLSSQEDMDQLVDSQHVLPLHLFSGCPGI